MGGYLAALVRGEKVDLGLLEAGRLKTIPFYAFRETAVRAVGWYQFMTRSDLRF